MAASTNTLTRRPHVDGTYLRLPEPPPEGVSSLDVVLNGHRVWSIDLVSADHDPLRHPWPALLKPHLDGTAHLELKDSTTDATIWASDVRFGSSDRPVEIVDALGRHLAINKWGRLGKTFEGADEGLRVRLLERLDELVDLLHELGKRPFVVGGTLLGAVRSGEILPHDDDADLAYLTDLQHPADIALENAELCRELRDRGYEIVRHSNTHLQITFRVDGGLVDEYIDIFTAFFTPDGQINQPFHVRGPMERSSLVPFSTVTLEGHEYPAPAIPEDWLVVNYDENWRTPLPGYKLRTPRATSRRFRSWFASYNFQRDFWENRYAEEQLVETELRGADELLEHSAPGDVVIDLGCGAGEPARQLSRHGRRVEAFDYSDAALSLARTLDTDEVDVLWRRANIADLREAADVLQVIATYDEPVHLLANHLFERLGHHGRENAWRIVRQVVRAGGTVVALIDTRPDPKVSFRDPSTWHLTIDQVEQEIETYGLRIAKHERLTGTARDAVRRPVILHVADGFERTTA